MASNPAWRPGETIRGAAARWRAEHGGTGRQGEYGARLARAAYEAGQRREAPPTARQAVGHHQPGQAPRVRISAHLKGEGRRVVEVDRRTARRIGRYESLVAAWAEGGPWRGQPVTAARFGRIVRRWAPVVVLGGDVPPGRYRLESDPWVILMALDEARAGGVETFEYERVA